MKKHSAFTYPQTIQQKAKYSPERYLSENTTRVLLLFYYLFYACRFRVIPWRYFQLNSNYFNAKKGIFSKLEIDQCIPAKNRLFQYLYTRDNPPAAYPVFIKPEWGQNSKGIVRIENQGEFTGEVIRRMVNSRVPYIVQEAAEGKEYEIYYLRCPEADSKYSFLSITQVVNRSDERLPINSIHNEHTVYRDITSHFSPLELEKIWWLIRDIGKFRMARIGVKAEGREPLLRGEFKVIEINLFLPMPLVLLAENVSPREKIGIIKKTMRIAARLVSQLPKNEKKKWLFFRKMWAHYRITP